MHSVGVMPLVYRSATRVQSVWHAISTVRLRATAVRQLQNLEKS